MDCTHCVEAIVECDGEKVCNICGTILNQIIDETPEWHDYENDSNRGSGGGSRTGFVTSSLLPESSYGSVVSFKGIKAGNDAIKSVQRLSCWSLSSNNERSWLTIFDNVETNCNRFGLPKSVCIDACGLYKGMPDAQKVRGETRRGLIAGAVYTACRNNGASRTHEEIAKLFNVSIRVLCKSIEKYSPTLNSVLDTQLGIADRLCSHQLLAGKITESDHDKIISLLYKISSSGEEFEHTPKTVVAGVVSFIASQCSKANIADASGVSVLSINKIVKKLATTLH
jgi:transcription initiation factor TFIIB